MKKLIYLLILSALYFISCTKDFVEKNIKNSNVSILAPANNFVTPNNTITFWWDALDGAEKYNLQIVKPNFAAIQELITDTNVTGTKFIKTLTPGSYQWRIRGMNAGGNTDYTVFNLTIDTTSNLANVTVFPLSPANGYLTAGSAITFSWDAVSNATGYQVNIETSGGSLIKNDNTTNTYYQYTLTPTAGQVNAYVWKVRALNAFSISQYNTPYTFTIDLAAPAQGSYPVKPLNNSTAKNTDTLKWTRPSTDTWSDSLFVSTDAAFTNVTKFKVYQTYKPVSQLSLNNNYIQYWWRLRSVDSVGNATGYSSVYTFTLTP